LDRARHCWRWIALFGAITAYSRSVVSQEALRSALSLDETLAANAKESSIENRHVRLGPIDGVFSLSSGLYLDDNVCLTETHKESDAILRSGVNMSLAWNATEQSNLRFETGVTYVEYFRGVEESGPEINPDSALAYTARIGDGSVTLFDQFDYLREARTESALANISHLSRAENTIGVRGQWAPNEFRTELGYSHNEYFSDSVSFQYLNRSAEYVFARGAWGFADSSEIGLESGGNVTSYENAKQNDNYAISVGPYVEWQATPSLRVTARGGPSFTTFSANPIPSQGSTLQTYYLGFDLAQEITPFLSQKIRVARDIQPGLNQGSAFIEQLTASYSVLYSLTQAFSLSFGFTYENGQQPFLFEIPGGGTFTELERFDRYTVLPEISWRFTDHFTAATRFSHSFRTSNLVGRNYIENVLSWHLTYQF
jgi:hypothetical protein